MTTSKPTPKIFNTTKYKKLINTFNKNMQEKEFERRCEPIVYDILLNYEGFINIEKGPNLIGTPFDFFGFKDDVPYIIEFKGSLHYFNTPGETQKRRMKEILKQIKCLGIALLQVKLKECQYRIFYNDDMKFYFKAKNIQLNQF